MPFESPPAADGTSEALRQVENFHAPPEGFHQSIQAQLSNPQDIASANQFFKPTGAEQYLPTVGHVGPQGIEMAAVQPHYPIPHMTGLETQGLIGPPPGGEMAALSGAPGVMPGAEQVSPLINMIMKMPGHISLVSSFFECLGAFFAPAQEMLGQVLEGFDAGALLDHAGAAGDALGEVMETAGEHASVDLTLLPADAPIFDQIGQPGIGDFTSSMEHAAPALGEGAPDLSHSFNTAPRLEVGGSPNQPLFETGSGVRGLNFDGAQGNYLAMDPNRGFGGTVGNFSPPAADPQNIPAQPATQAPASGGHHSSALDFRRDALLGNGHHTPAHPHGGDAQAAAQPRGVDAQAAAQHQAGGNDVWAEQQASQGDQVAPQADQVAEAQDTSAAPAPEQYTVHRGDNLWDIARSHLGDGTRWQEIYDLNRSVLGDNPRMIMPGTQLQLPGDAIASSGIDYTVKPGDNLWNISQEHLGGGQNWHELYQHNEAVVGSNPDLIHPGQHLHMDGTAADHSSIAAGDASHTTHHSHLASHHAGGHQAAGHNHLATHQTGGPHAAQPNHVAQHHGPGAAPAKGNELQAQPRSLSSIESYGDASNHVVDSTTQVPSSH